MGFQRTDGTAGSREDKERPRSWGSSLPFALKPPFGSDFRGSSQVGEVGELGERRIQFQKLLQATGWRRHVGSHPHKYAGLDCGNEGGPAFPEQSRSKVLSTEQAAVMGFQVALV